MDRARADGLRFLKIDWKITKTIHRSRMIIFADSMAIFLVFSMFLPYFVEICTCYFQNYK